MVAMLSAADRFGLLDLVSLYAHAVDARDIPAVVRCFTPGGRLEFVSTGTVLHGHEEMTAFYERAFSGDMLGSGATSTHMMANTMVTATDDGADAVTSAVAFLATSGVVHHTDSTAGRVTVRGLTYTDRCVRAGQLWVFAERVHRLHWQGEMAGGSVSSDPLGPT